jgi:Flp pilus assembly protein TadG
MSREIARRRGPRRGANTIEFALIAPILFALLGGLVDYGWYFWREALLVNGLREAVRAGGLQLQGDAETGMTCSQCLTAASFTAASELAKQKYTNVTATPRLERIPATGTPCTYAVVIETTLPHARLFALVPGPTDIDIRVLSMAQNLSCE